MNPRHSVGAPDDDDHLKVAAYDTDAEASAFRERRPPNWQEAAAALEAEGHYYPQRV